MPSRLFHCDCFSIYARLLGAWARTGPSTVLACVVSYESLLCFLATLETAGNKQAVAIIKLLTPFGYSLRVCKHVSCIKLSWYLMKPVSFNFTSLVAHESGDSSSVQFTVSIGFPSILHMGEMAII